MRLAAIVDHRDVPRRRLRRPSSSWILKSPGLGSEIHDFTAKLVPRLSFAASAAAAAALVVAPRLAVDYTLKRERRKRERYLTLSTIDVKGASLLNVNAAEMR